MKQKKKKKTPPKYPKPTPQNSENPSKQPEMHL